MSINITNVTAAMRHKRHENFVNDIHTPICALVQTLPYSQRCDYVKSSPACSEGVALINYVHLLYCGLNTNNDWKMWFGVLVLILMCAYLFVMLACTADGFFCPSLSVLSSLLGLSENVAGVTLVAFGNGASDFFTSLAGMKNENRVIFSDIFGGAAFVFLIVGGAIILITPFVIQPALFMRDCCFLLLDMLIVEYMADSTRSLSIIGCILYIALYFLYIAVVIIDQYLVLRALKIYKERRKETKRLARAERKFMKLEATVVPISMATRRASAKHRLQRFQALARGALEAHRANLSVSKLETALSDGKPQASRRASQTSTKVDDQETVRGRDAQIDQMEAGTAQGQGPNEKSANPMEDIEEQPKDMKKDGEESRELSSEHISDQEAKKAKSETSISREELQGNGSEPKKESLKDQVKADETEEVRPTTTNQAMNDVNEPSKTNAASGPKKTSEIIDGEIISSSSSSESEAEGEGEGEAGAEKKQPISFYAATMVMLSKKLLRESCESLDCFKRKNRMLAEPTTLCRQFWTTMNPFGDDFCEKTIFLQFFTILKLPIVIFLTLLIPVVDYEKPIYGWSKLLNCIQLVILPGFIALSLTGLEPTFYLPIFAWVMIAMFPIALAVFLTTSVNKVPMHFKLFCILGVLGSMFTIFICCKEVINILSVIGIATYCSSSFLGCTLLAWGNSVGDLITNTAMARQGYTKMGFAACIGGPLFSSIVTMGSVYLYKSAYTDNLPSDVGQGIMGTNSIIFLLIGVSFVLVASLSTNFVLRRSIGALMILTYGMYGVFALVGELEWIHPYGTDHRMDLKPEQAY